jgi:hypothetical protein
MSRHVRRLAALGLVAATAGAAVAPAAHAGEAQTTTVRYSVTVKQGALENGRTVRARAVVTNPEASVADWWGRSAITSVVRRAVNGGIQEPFGAQGFRCTPRVSGATTSYTCRLRGADVPTTIRLTFAVRFAS